MTSLNIKEEEIPRVPGKVAIVTGGSSGIGLATTQLLCSLGATVHILDRSPPPAEIIHQPPSTSPGPRGGGSIAYHPCELTSWSTLLAVFNAIGHVDIVVANAGVSQESDYFADTFTAAGTLAEPAYGVIDVNFKATVNVIKLALRAFRMQWGTGRMDSDGGGGGGGGSLVLTSSATAYAPEASLPVYSASKLAQIGLVRALRPTLPLPEFGNSTINAVAPAATITALLPADLAAPIRAAGLPVSEAHHVALAIAWSATARQSMQVEGYGKDSRAKVESEGRWNGRVILTLGNRWTEIEEPLARARAEWMGKWNADMTALQQAATDMRGAV